MPSADGLQNCEIQHNGACLTYTVAGDRSSHHLCLLPGWCGARDFWRDQISYFAKDYFVVTIDFPGFGHSHLPRENNVFSMEFLADFVSIVLQREKLLNCIMLGHSAGGALALTTAALAPSRVDAVIGVDAFTHTDFHLQMEEEIVRETVAPLTDDFDSGVRALASSYFLESSAPTLKTEVVEIMAEVEPTLALEILRSFLRWDILDYLDRYDGTCKRGCSTG